MKLIDLFEQDTPAAIAHEKSIVAKFKEKDAKIWAEPKGSDTGWPDVGATFKLPSGTLHVHVEAKTGKADRMGSLRRWTFDGTKFSASGDLDENDELILDVMNSDPNVKSRAKKLLKLIHDELDPGIKEISSGMIAHIKDKQERHDRLVEFLKKAKASTDFEGTGAGNFQLSSPRVDDPRIGKGILNHYKSKYKPKAGGSNIMLFILGSEMFLAPGSDAPEKLVKEFAELFDAKDIASLPESFGGNLEVRVQARGLSKGGEKPVKFDVQAVLRGGKDLKKAKGTPFK